MVESNADLGLRDMSITTNKAGSRKRDKGDDDLWQKFEYPLEDLEDDCILSLEQPITANSKGLTARVNRKKCPGQDEESDNCDDNDDHGGLSDSDNSENSNLSDGNNDCSGLNDSDNSDNSNLSDDNNDCGGLNDSDDSDNSNLSDDNNDCGGLNDSDDSDDSDNCNLSDDNNDYSGLNDSDGSDNCNLSDDNNDYGGLNGSDDSNNCNISDNNEDSGDDGDEETCSQDKMCDGDHYLGDDKGKKGDPKLWTPSINDVFGSLRQARAWIDVWAANIGFKIRTGKSKPSEGASKYTRPALCSLVLCITAWTLTQESNDFSVKFVCTLEGSHISRKVDDEFSRHNKPVSMRCNCPFFINMTSPRSIHPKWHITKMYLQHNGHDMDPELGKYVILSDEMLATIDKFATIAAGIDLTLRCLAHEHPGKVINKTDVASNYRKFKKAGAPIKISQTAQLFMLLNQQQPLTLETQEGWYYEADFHPRNQLRRLFWMSPNQRDLYRRYHDVVVNDTTAKTNRLKMRLNCFVVVDANFKTRLVACALTRRESEEDYKWILGQLRKASGGILPRVLMVDEDYGMDSACPAVFEQTHIINCIWHINKNVQKHLSPALGEESFQSFKRQFAQVRDSITITEFEAAWGQLLNKYGGDGDGEVVIENDGRRAAAGESDGNPLYTGIVGKYLLKLYRRRHHWAGPWVRASFTAGMRSTQRVEMTHNLIKMLKVNNNTSLSDLFRAITQKVENEKLFKPKSNMAKRQLNQYGVLAVQAFKSVLRMNKTYLTGFAMSKLKVEMEHSFNLSHETVDLQTVTRAWGVASNKTHSVSAVDLGCSLFVLEFRVLILFAIHNL